MPGRPPSASTSSPESSPMTVAPGPRTTRPNSALMRAFDSYVSPVSSGQPSATSGSIVQPGRSRSNSRALWALREASVACRSGEGNGGGLGLALADGGNARLGEGEQLVERLARERVALRGRLHLDEPTVAAHDDVHVRVRVRVLRVVEVEQRNAVHDADGDGRHRVAEGAREAEALERSHRGDVRTADRCAARAAVGLEDVAVEPERPLAKRLEVRDCPHRAADQPLDLDRPPLLLAARRLALDALAGRGRQERVLRRDPALALAPQPARDVLLDHRRAEDLRPALRDDDRAVRVLEVVGLEGDRPELVRLASAFARAHATAPSSAASVTCSTSLTGSWRKRRPSSRNASGSPVVRKRYAPTRSPSCSAPLRASVSATSRAVSSAEKTSVTSRPNTRSKILRISG